MKGFSFIELNLIINLLFEECMLIFLNVRELFNKE